MISKWLTTLISNNSAQSQNSNDNFRIKLITRAYLISDKNTFNTLRGVPQFVLIFARVRRNYYREEKNVRFERETDCGTPDGVRGAFEWVFI